MTLLPYLALCLLAAGAALLGLGRAGRTAIGISVLLLTAALVSALAVPIGPSPMGGAPLVVDGYLRLVAALGCASAVGLTTLAAALGAGRHSREGTPVMLAAVPLVGALVTGVGTLALALDPVDAALPAALAGGVGLFGLAALAHDPTPGATGRAALRATAIAGGLVILASAVVLGGGNPLAGQPLAAGAAILVLAGAIGLRVGAIPFHGSVARLVTRAGLLAPVILLWAAIPLVVSAIGVIASGISPLALPLGVERGLIALAAGVTLLAAPVVASLTDDMDQVVAYSIVADAGLLLLAFAAGPPAWEPIRTWLLIMTITKTALIAWSAAMRDAFGTTRLGELHGWAIRAPILAGALALVAVATLGLPTFASAAVRRDIADAVFREPLASGAFAVSLLAVLPYLRLAAVGLSTPGPLVRRAPDERLRRPVAWARRSRARSGAGGSTAPGGVPGGVPRAASTTPAPPTIRERSGQGRDASDTGTGLADAARLRRDPDAERAAARVADIARRFAIGAGRSGLPSDRRSGANADDRPRSPAGRAEPARGQDGRAGRTMRAPRVPIRERLKQFRADLSEAWRLNLVPIAAGLVLTLAACSFLVSVGLFDLRSAAAERLPVPMVPTPAASPAGGAGATASPDGSPAGVPDPTGSAAPSGSTAP